MVKKRKPLFVSEEAHIKLTTLAAQKRMFRGDVVDILLEVKTDDQIDLEYREDTRNSKRARKIESA